MIVQEHRWLGVESRPGYLKGGPNWATKGDLHELILDYVSPELKTGDTLAQPNGRLLVTYIDREKKLLNVESVDGQKPIYTFLFFQREPWDKYFMQIAQVVATRATCDRKHVGAVIINTDREILSTGYNGSPKGMPHCDTAGHMMEDGHCVRTTHAEANAIIQARESLSDSTIYTTASPCWPCMKLIINSGIKTICYHEIYRDERITEFAKQTNITLRQV